MNARAYIKSMLAAMPSAFERPFRHTTRRGGVLFYRSANGRSFYILVNSTMRKQLEASTPPR